MLSLYPGVLSYDPDYPDAGVSPHPIDKNTNCREQQSPKRQPVRQKRCAQNEKMELIVLQILTPPPSKKGKSDYKGGQVWGGGVSIRSCIPPGRTILFKVQNILMSSGICDYIIFDILFSASPPPFLLPQLKVAKLQTGSDQVFQRS